MHFCLNCKTNIEFPDFGEEEIYNKILEKWASKFMDMKCISMVYVKIVLKRRFNSF